MKYAKECVATPITPNRGCSVPECCAISTAIAAIATAAGITHRVDRRPWAPRPRSRSRGRWMLVLAKINPADIQKSADWVLPYVQIVASIRPQAASTSAAEIQGGSGFDSAWAESRDMASDIADSIGS